MKRLLRNLSLFRRAPEPPQVASRFVASVPARLLLSIAHAKGCRGHSQKKLIGSTQNISESGLAIIVPTLSDANGPISEGDELRVTLDLHPLSMVEMNCLVVHLHEVRENESLDYLMGLKIIMMNTNDRAIYLEYLGTYGWEKAAAENDSS